jgi:hypothetical protein
MKPNSALLASLSCGAAAVLLVGLDLAFNVDAALEVQSGGSWETLMSTKDSGSYPVRGPACGKDFRLTIHNGMPWSSKVDITFQLSNGNPMHQTWTLSAGETRSSEGFHLNGTAQPSGVPSKGFSSLSVQVGTLFYGYASACPEATA